MISSVAKVGMTMIVRDIVCRIIKVLPAGTVEVVSPDGKLFRVSGLSF